MKRPISPVTANSFSMYRGYIGRHHDVPMEDLKLAFTVSRSMVPIFKVLTTLQNSTTITMAEGSTLR